MEKACRQNRIGFADCECVKEMLRLACPARSDNGNACIFADCACKLDIIARFFDRLYP